jgi:hypothetical protein
MVLDCILSLRMDCGVARAFNPVRFLVEACRSVRLSLSPSLLGRLIKYKVNSSIRGPLTRGGGGKGPFFGSVIYDFNP